MRIVIWLSNAVGVFAPTLAQLTRLEQRLPGHTLLVATTESDFLALLPTADAVVVWNFVEAWYALAPRLRAVCTPAAGREAIAIDPSGRVERRFGHFHGAIMAESLLAMILFMNRRFGDAMEAQRAREWDRSRYETTRRLAGQTVLIIGYGAIGRHAARLLGALGVRVQGLKRQTGAEEPGVERLYSPEQLHEALAGADHVVCILPGDTGTDRLLDAAAFAHIKTGACVYNLGRGNAIDVNALVGALASGRVAGAFLDVVPEEPLPATSPLWTVPNLFLTPHASAMSKEYLDLYFDELAAWFAIAPL